MMTGKKRIEVDPEKQKCLIKARNETSLLEDVKDATVASIKVIEENQSSSQTRCRKRRRISGRSVHYL